MIFINFVALLMLNISLLKNHILVYLNVPSVSTLYCPPVVFLRGPILFLLNRLRRQRGIFIASPRPASHPRDIKSYDKKNATAAAVRGGHEADGGDDARAHL